jgi:putative ABC transport system ATP-binding protein
MPAKERHAKVALALQLVGLADRHDHYPRQLSGGQEQRVAIARAIVADPKILVADEPTGDLDAASAASVMALLGRLHEELGKTLIMVTHDPRTAGFAQQVLHLEKGKLVEQKARGAAPVGTT